MKKTVLALGTLLLAGQAWAFPMKPDIRLLLQEAKQPSTHFVPARAGWNGPEESATPAINATYEELLHEPSSEQRREELISAAIPDWRACVAIFFLIGLLRAMKGGKVRTKQPATLVAFPAATMRPRTEVSEAA